MQNTEVFLKAEGARSCDARVAESAGDASLPDTAASANVPILSSRDGGVADTFCDGASQLRCACRAGALVCLVAFWFDGGLFKLATASVFWILLELGADVPKVEGRRKNKAEKQNLVAPAATNTA